MIHQLSTEVLSSGLATRRLARRIIVLDEVSSTNDHAMDMIAKPEGPASDGAVVFAELQTAGRGRLGRSWQAPKGSSLTFTVLLWEKQLPASPVRWMMAAAVAVSRGIAGVTEIEPTIRWPNDIHIQGKKVCGVLVEARNLSESWAVAIGIGINCLQQPAHFSQDLRDKATSLEIESRHPVDRVKVAQSVLTQLDALLCNESGTDDESLADLWREGSADIGTRATLRTNGQDYLGVIIDVHPRTGLVLQMDAGGRKLFDPALTTRIS
jgi:BirA family biotin operon repressor/biotin-[acetyl-CoA-carboxylase] ligase